MNSQMRFDDRLATIFDQAEDGLSARVAAWSQLADILAQDRGRLTSTERAAVIEALQNWQIDVPFERRRAVAAVLANQSVPVDLVAIFACDSPSIAAPILSTVTLNDAEWSSIIAAAPPTSRALLRQRRDLPERVTQSLNSFGMSDFALESAGVVNTVATPTPRPTQISDLVARIDAFQRDRSRRLVPVPEVSFRCEQFRFETDSNGIINWVDGAPREAILGLSIAEMAAPGGYGVDGVAAGAFRQRSEVNGANLLIGGNGDASGQWLVSAKPRFDAPSGRLFGYRGTARRRGDQIGQGGANRQPVNHNLEPEFARQLVHELRTPLNAISGFSEMISQQLLGPVAHIYRQKARDILEQAAKLTAVFDDLESDARLSSGTFETTVLKRADAKRAIEDVVAVHEHFIENRDVTLRLAFAPNCAPVAVDARSLERLIDRILTIVIGAAAPAEVISLRLKSDANADICCEFDRPRSLLEFGKETLLDPAFEHIDESAFSPALGVAFTFRLVTKLAQAFGGRFSIDARHFTLILPRAGDTEVEAKESC